MMMELDNKNEEITILGNVVHENNVTETEILPSWIKYGIDINPSMNDVIKVNKMKCISKDIQKLIKKNYKTLFPVQYSVIPVLINDHSSVVRPKDLCICAPTGCGKTMAYAIPIIQIISHNISSGIQAIVVLPVRDLAYQIYEVFTKLTENINVNVVCLNGFHKFNKEKSQLSNSGIPADIVICTPGRLVDHIRNNDEFKLNKLKFLVIDEADCIISEEKQDWYVTLIEHIPDYQDNLVQNFINRFKKPYLQKILVSATFQYNPLYLERFNLWFPRLFRVRRDLMVTKNGENEGIKKNEEVQINTVADIHTAPQGLSEYFVLVDKEYIRIIFIIHLIRTRRLEHGASRILCFCNTKTIAERLLSLLAQFDNIKGEYLSCDIPKRMRIKLRKSLEIGDLDILVTVDSMSRGMNYDIDNKSENHTNLVIIQYHLPKQMETYVHRVGRTARKGLTGESFALCTKKQLFHLKKDLQNLGHRIKPYKLQKKKIYKYLNEYNAALKNLQEGKQDDVDMKEEAE